MRSSSEEEADSDDSALLSLSDSDEDVITRLISELISIPSSRAIPESESKSSALTSRIDSEEEENMVVRSRTTVAVLVSELQLASSSTGEEKGAGIMNDGDAAGGAAATGMISLGVTTEVGDAAGGAEDGVANDARRRASNCR